MLDGVLEVRSAYVRPEQGVFQLFARVAYPVNDDIRAALKDGLMLNFDLDVVVSRERRFWMDETVAEYTLRRELLLSRGQRSLRGARRRLAQPASNTATPRWKKRSRRSAPWMRGRSCCRRSSRPTASTACRLRAGVRRGRLSDTMRVLLFWTDDWHRESEWFSWSLQR